MITEGKPHYVLFIAAILPTIVHASCSRTQSLGLRDLHETSKLPFIREYINVSYNYWASSDDNMSLQPEDCKIADADGEVFYSGDRGKRAYIKQYSAEQKAQLSDKQRERV
jgi:hypothetical protein